VIKYLQYCEGFRHVLLVPSDVLHFMRLNVVATKGAQQKPLEKSYSLAKATNCKMLCNLIVMLADSILKGMGQNAQQLSRGTFVLIWIRSPYHRVMYLSIIPLAESMSIGKHCGLPVNVYIHQISLWGTFDGVFTTCLERFVVWYML